MTRPRGGQALPGAAGAGSAGPTGLQQSHHDDANLSRYELRARAIVPLRNAQLSESALFFMHWQSRPGPRSCPARIEE